VPRVGLTPEAVVLAGAELADETGLEGLGMGVLAERLGCRTPSLYKHVDGLADLTHRIGVLAMHELADAVGQATQGRSGREALAAAAEAMRAFVLQRPGRYAAGNAARPAGPDDPLVGAGDRLLSALAAVLRGYRLAPDQEIHALRTLRSALHGFASLEHAGGFMIETDVGDSFTWMVALLDQGLRAEASAADG